MKNFDLKKEYLELQKRIQELIKNQLLAEDQAKTILSVCCFGLILFLVEF